MNVPHLTSCKSPHGHHPAWTVLVTVRSPGDDRGGWAWRAGPSGVGRARRRTWSSVWTGPRKYGLTSRPCENQPGPLSTSRSSARAAGRPVPAGQSEGTEGANGASVSPSLSLCITLGPDRKWALVFRTSTSKGFALRNHQHPNGKTWV